VVELSAVVPQAATGRFFLFPGAAFPTPVFRVPLVACGFPKVRPSRFFLIGYVICRLLWNVVVSPFFFPPGFGLDRPLVSHALPFGSWFIGRLLDHQVFPRVLLVDFPTPLLRRFSLP